MSRKLRSFIHVAIQFGTMIYLIASGSLLASSILVLIEIAGIILGTWSIIVMRKSYLSIFPEPSKNFRLIEKGPYKLIRHPMYTALFLTFLPLVIERPDIIRVFIYALFLVNQVLKLIYEEQLIESEIPGYLIYKKSTWRIIPYVF